MASSYTSSLGLVLPVQGELSGTWGDTVNNYLTTYIDAAVAGAQTVTTNTTLTKTTGSSLDATSSQYAIIIASPASANITITAPAASKIYTIINTSGTYTVTIRGAGPTTGVTLGVNEKAQVAWNGSDFVKIGSPLSTPYTANGVVYASSTSALATGSALTFNGSTLTTLNANAIFSSGSSSTAGVTTSGAAGTQGAIQFGSSQTTFNIQGGPDYVGNVYNVATGTSHQWAIAASEQMRLTSTGLGIGTSSPGYRLDVEKSSDGTIGYFRRIGATVNPALTIYANETGNTVGFGTDYAGATSPAITFSIATSEKMRLDTSGNLGLGVTPSAWGSSFKVMQFGAVGSISENGFNDAYFATNWRFDGTTSRYIVNDWALQYAQQNGEHIWFNAPSGTAGNAITFTQAMTLDASGNLGIGVTSPSSYTAGGSYLALALNGANGSNISLNGGGSQIGLVYAATGNSNVYVTNQTASGNLIFGVGSGSERMRLDSSGNLGLGVTPSAGLATADYRLFEIGLNGGGSLYSGNCQFLIGTNIAWVASTANYKTSNLASLYDQTAGVHSWKIAPSGTAGNPITFTQAMTLDASGNLLVGTTSTGFVNDNGWTKEGASVVQRHVSSEASGSTYTYFIYNATQIGSITQSGTTAVLYNVTSDQRLKENIADADSASTLIDALQVRKFDWKADGNHQRYGFVAQELVTVAPEAVHQPTDTEQMMAVDYSKLVPMLVKEIQSLRIRISQLESK